MILGSPLVWGAGAILAGFGAAAWILRWEIRYQMKQRRYGGFMIGGDR